MPKKNIVFFTILFLLFILAITLRIDIFNQVEKRSPDEQIYTYQAKTIASARTPLKGIRLLVQDYKADNKLWIFPPPTRIGYLWPISNLIKFKDSNDIKRIASFSLAINFISLLFLIIIGLKFFNFHTVFYAFLFIGVSAMDIFVSVRAWPDALLGFFGLMLVYLCCEISRDCDRIIYYILFFLSGICCLLIKESGIVIYGLSALWVLWTLFIQKRRFLNATVFVIVGIFSIGIALSILAYAVGGLGNLVEIYRYERKAMITNPYAIEYQSGPAYYFLQTFWWISPLSVFFYLLAIFGSFLPEKILHKINFPIDRNSTIYRGIIFFVVTFALIAAFIPGQQNLRYITATFIPFYLLSGLGFWKIIFLIKSIAKQSFRFLIIPLAVIIAIASLGDYLNCRKMFLLTGGIDLSVKMIRWDLYKSP